MSLAQVPLHAGSSQHRAGDAVILALLCVENANAFQPAHPDPIIGEQFLVFVHLGEKHVAKGAALLFEALVEFV